MSCLGIVKTRSTLHIWGGIRASCPPSPHTLTGNSNGCCRFRKNDQDMSPELIEDQISRWNRFQEEQAFVLLERAQQLKLRIPQSYLTFLRMPQLLRRLYSYNGCLWGLPDGFPSISDAVGTHLLYLMQDYQGCAYWYLCLTSEGNSGVVVTARYFGGRLDERDESSNEESHEFPEPCVDDLCLVENTFESFVYRFWIENQISHDLRVRKTALTGEALNYASHYKSQ